MSKILLVIPHDRFHDEELEVIQKKLASLGHKVAVGSSHHTEAQGHFGQLVKPDIEVSFVEPRDYDALIFIGGRGIDEYIGNQRIVGLVRSFWEEGKLVGALGRAVEIFVFSGILSGRKATCDISTIPSLQSAGAYYSGSLVEEDENIITGTGAEAANEFANILEGALKWNTGKGELYARTP